ncbi:hypothetical protein ABB37_08578 [Leptomonas pyrrhocoris]|uniref:Secreted protein n=1 Tax=Leptomonas pyrrhocoris TaxID=157538 RepID=A0A0M9FSU4_LEPPY|nr:hypothetical protein ABB37_08578 [Leptomonas pyrrhocoris]KPA75277.1 hypothetical protein ABB37_08578 [Leptomonas pyrrhocoris]|eukprot:XP_015653716.1 hypothetical protein ABB37_08578 [Leptomonas pyrrhocoris]
MFARSCIQPMLLFLVSPSLPLSVGESVVVAAAAADVGVDARLRVELFLLLSYYIHTLCACVCVCASVFHIQKLLDSTSFYTHWKRKEDDKKRCQCLHFRSKGVGEKDSDASILPRAEWIARTIVFEVSAISLSASRVLQTAFTFPFYEAADVEVNRDVVGASGGKTKWRRKIALEETVKLLSASAYMDFSHTS